MASSAGPSNALGLLGCETRRKVIEFGETGFAAPDDAVNGLGITNTSQVVVDGRMMLTRADTTTESSCTACLILFFDSLNETLEHVDVMELSDGGPIFHVLFRKSSSDVSLW